MLYRHLVLVCSVCENEVLLIYIIQQKDNSIWLEWPVKLTFLFLGPLAILKLGLETCHTF